MTRSVLVTGATGTVGRHVFADLRERDVSARGATRDPEAAARRFDGDSGYVEFGFDRPETWGAALDGVDAAFLLRPPGVDTDRIRGFVDAAARVGLDHVVYLSTLGADRNPLLPHHRIERHLAAADPTHTPIRASFFMQNLHEVHGEDLRERGEIFVPAGGGRTSFVDARDVGAVAARTLVDDDQRGVAHEPTGPVALDYHEVAAVVSDVLDRRIEYANPSIPRFLLRELRRGRPPGFALLMVGIYTTARLGLADRVTDDVERVLGRPPRGIREYVADYAAEFEPAG